MRLSFIPQILFIFLLFSCGNSSKQNVKHNEAILKTKWTDELNTKSVLSEYPRPILKRQKWLSLNGYWQVETSEVDQIDFGEDLSNEILVPYAVESYLSGIMKKTDHLLYRKVFSIPKDWKQQHILLNFEAVDYEASIYLNGKKIGGHKGGFDPFSFDITSFLVEGKQELIVKVTDKTNDKLQPVGKQVRDPHGIFYTSTTGIWQTVWIEPVENNYIKNFRLFPDIDNQTIAFKANSLKNEGILRLILKDEGKIVSEAVGKANEIVKLNIPNPKLWSPEQPFLYDLDVQLLSDGIAVDEFSSYVAMREIDLGKNDDGKTVITLNNKPYFQIGVLDQGYWPDGLMTPPSEEAYIWDIKTFKEMGFNLLRKHAKTESQRWYYLCDKIGMLVWQDMPQMHPHEDFEKRLKQKDKAQFETELEEIVNDFYNYQCIVMWVIFNEGWGQYDTERLTNYVTKIDSTRLVSNASGWTDMGVGDIIDMHSYPGPDIYDSEENRATVLGEFGGLGLSIKDHLWQEDNWGYKKMTDSLDFLNNYKNLWQKTWQMKDAKSASAVVYTQLSDLEGEVNGLVTYDREVIKIPINTLYDIHTDNIISPVSIYSNHSMFQDSIEVSLKNRKGEPIFYTLDGSQPTINSNKYSAPITISSSTNLKARSINATDKSAIAIKSFKKVDSLQQAPITLNETLKDGLNFEYFEGSLNDLSELEKSDPVKSGVTHAIGLQETSKSENFGFSFEGYIGIVTDGVYSFQLTSDDGSRLTFNHDILINHDGHHAMTTKTADLPLAKGYYPIKLDYFQAGGGVGLQLIIIDPDGKKLSTPIYARN